MSLSKETLRKEIRTELCEALKFVGRAANLLRHARKDYYMPDRSKEILDTIDALAQILASTSEYVNNLLSK